MSSAPRTIAAAQAALRNKEISAVELTQLHLQRIADKDTTTRAFLATTGDQALAAATAADAAGTAGMGLSGIPLSLKDIISLRGAPTTAGSKMLAGYHPPYNATVTEKLQAAGAAILGKTNMDEFALGSSTEKSAYHPTHNPWDAARIPGGTSGGSAAAVAAGMGLGSLGTDTGGSIRQPAAMCGVTGMKPTYGRVSRYGVIAAASSLDQVGPIARTVQDCAIILESIAGRDTHDATSLADAVPTWSSQLPTTADLSGMRIGLPQEYLGSGLHYDIHKALDAAIAQLEALGATVVPVTMPSFKAALSAYYIVNPAEVSSNMARFDGLRFGITSPETDLHTHYAAVRAAGFGPEVKRRIILGNYILSAGYDTQLYRRAITARRAIENDYTRIFGDVDAIIGPTSPETAWLLGEKSSDPLKMYLADIYTIATNLARIPAMSLPCGFDRSGLPIGLQLQAPRLREDTLFRIGHAYQLATDWHMKEPAL